MIPVIYNKTMPDKTSLLEAAQHHASNADYCDVFFENTFSNTIVYEDGKVDKLLSGIDCGKSIRTIKGIRVENEYSSQTTDSMQSTQTTIEAKIELIEKADRAARAVSPHIRQVTVSYGDKCQEVAIANSSDNYSHGQRLRTRFIVNVIAEKNGMIQTGYETAGALSGFELFQAVDVCALAQKAAERAVRMLDAPHAPAGKMQVVIMSEAGGTLIHEACGHGLEADFIVKGTSVYGGKVGQKVASDLVTVIDDASMPGNYGSYEFDDEGTPAQKKVLIENGILKGYMSDIYNSRILGIPSSGNGRRESFISKPQPRMTNTYIEKGTMSPEEIIGSVCQGLLIVKLGGGQVNVTNGDFVFDIQEAFSIEDYKIKSLVRGAMLIGNGPKILEEIDMVGNDLHFITGTCGKGDHAPVTDAMPTLRIPSIVVGGR